MRRRARLTREAKNMLLAYMPYEVLQPWVRGYWRHPFMNDLCCDAGVDGEAAS